MPTLSPALLPDPYRLLTRPEAAALARSTVVTLDRWIAAGTLPVVRIGARVLIRAADVRAYLAAHDPDAPPAEPAEPVDCSRLLTYAEAAAALRLSRTTLDRLQAEGALSMYRVGSRWKIRAGALAAFIDAHAVPATAGPLAGLPA